MTAHSVSALVSPVEPEFRYCTRCDVCLPQHRDRAQCEDCETLNQFHPGGSHGGGFAPIDPAYEVSLHFPTRPKEDRTIATLDSLKMPYRTYTAKNDPLEVAFARGLFASDIEPNWPIVLITSHGTPVEHWDGFNLTALNTIPAARERATEPQPCVPADQEQAA